MKLLHDAWILAKLMALGKASREVYIILAVAKLGAFICGVLLGSWLF